LPHSNPVALWAVAPVRLHRPRAGIRRAGDFKVFHEPFSVYYSPERRSDRFAETGAKQKYGYKEVLDLMLAVEEKPVYFKDMAYHVASIMSGEFVSRFTNTRLLSGIPRR
jgi:hypothetical protein